MDFNLIGIIAGIPGLIIAIVVHEYAHARVAVAMGDFTPKATGRLTLNPMAHLDPIGLLMLLLCQFGWAKPVMVNPLNFKNYKRGELLVALAGPAVNLITAFLALLILQILATAGVEMTTGVRMVFSLIILYNINFSIFNMIPIPPLDGSKVLMSFLSSNLQYKLMSLERYSFIILIFIMMTPILRYILVPLQKLILGIFYLILGIIF